MSTPQVSWKCYHCSKDDRNQIMVMRPLMSIAMIIVLRTSRFRFVARGRLAQGVTSENLKVTFYMHEDHHYLERTFRSWIACQNSETSQLLASCPLFQFFWWILEFHALDETMRPWFTTKTPSFLKKKAQERSKYYLRCDGDEGSTDGRNFIWPSGCLWNWG